ncbi:MAG: 2-C-methyl-D-erythritol 2,4-cyclodiphosphate synthase [Candidatus Cryosericum sp.]|nr:2-C-methyl-D-erythritol 2,4-cyclodiphosphate synthase [bacterium]
MTVVRAHKESLSAIVVAAGNSTRFGRDKLFSSFAGRPLICTTLEAICSVPIRKLVLVCRPQDRLRMEKCVARAILPHRVQVLLAIGGSTRSESVRNGLNVLVDDGVLGDDWILVHDGDRPAVGRGLLRRLIAARDTGEVVIPVLTLSDSLRRVSSEGTRVVNRTGMVAVQTPQLCKVSTLKSAYEQCPEGAVFTDEAALIESHGGKVATVHGDVQNIKVTVPEDLRIARMAFDTRLRTIVGFGYDVHRFETGRPLMLGGVRIASDVGLAGTSDADVVLHAAMDAVLGCAGAGDIGSMFPSSDAQYIGIDSAILLERVMMNRLVRRLRIVMVDITIVAERPRLSIYQETMRRRVARLFGVQPKNVNVKVTGNDTIGWIGRGEGIAALCVVTAVRPA